MMSNGVEEVIGRVKQKLSDALQVEVEDVVVRSKSDDPNGVHLEIEVVSTLFGGKRSMLRQQLVFKAIWDEMQDGTVHAVDSIVATAPGE